MTDLDKAMLEDRIDEAQARVEAFDLDAERDRVHLARLRKEHPHHPTLLLLYGLRGLGTGFLVGAVALTTAVQLSAGMAETLAELEALLGVQVPWLLCVLALSSWAMSIGAFALAERRACSSPLLPHELQARRALVSEVLRLRALRDVRERTPDILPDRPAWQVDLPPHPEWTPPLGMHFPRRSEA